MLRSDHEADEDTSSETILGLKNMTMQTNQVVEIEIVAVEAVAFLQTTARNTRERMMRRRMNFGKGALEKGNGEIEEHDLMMTEASTKKKSKMKKRKKEGHK